MWINKSLRVTVLLISLGGIVSIIDLLCNLVSDGTVRVIEATVASEKGAQDSNLTNALGDLSFKDVDKFQNPKTSGDEKKANINTTAGSRDPTSASEKKYFPQVIHVTLKSKKSIPPQVQANLDSFRRLNPNHELRIYDDSDIREMVVQNLPQMLDMFDSFGKNVERADFWRYLVMFVEGGVYADTDVECLKPIDRWGEVFGANLGAIVGIEADISDEKERKRQGFVSTVQFCQWTFQSKAGHQIFNRTLHNIYNLVQLEKVGALTLEGDEDWQVIQRTGPGIFTKTVNEFLQEYNLSGKQVNKGFPVVGDVGILTVHGFGFRPGVDSWPDNYDRDVCVSHHFFGGWKGNT
jgi:mannosyltransferase OCH1-like enzyme